MVALERKRDYRYKENWVDGRKEYEAQRQREREGRNLKGKDIYIYRVFLLKQNIDKYHIS